MTFLIHIFIASFLIILFPLQYYLISQFQDAMLFRDSALLDRIFQVFDSNRNDLIDFNEYILCLSTVSNKAPPEAKLERTFFLF